ELTKREEQIKRRAEERQKKGLTEAEKEKAKAEAIRKAELEKKQSEGKSDAETAELRKKQEMLRQMEEKKRIQEQVERKKNSQGGPVLRSLDDGKEQVHKGAGAPPKVAPPAARNVAGKKGAVPSQGATDLEKKQAMQRAAQEALTQSDPGAKLKIEFGTERHDFGKVRQGDQVEHEFHMQAAGTTPLKIRQVKPSCGCTVGSVKVADEEGNYHDYTYGDPIEPGRNIIVTAAVNTTNKKNKAQVRVQIMSNDPAGTHSLTLAAEVQPFLHVTPPIMNFGDIPMGGQRDQTVDIRTAHGEMVMMHVDPARLGVIPKGITLDLQPVNPNEEGKSSHWTVAVHIGSDALEGQANAALRILTDVELPIDPHKREQLASTGQPIVPQYFSANVTVQARILGSFTLDRPYLSFGLVRPGQIAPRVARLTCNEESFQFGEGLKVELRGKDGGEFEFPELFETSIRPVPGVSAVDIELLLKGFPDGVDQSFSGELVIKTGHPSSPDKTVRFSGVCRSGVNAR
ncbi:MAG: DUF1573 domain-containing protein, partial [Planctomycetes bacterium]|nr:DUF1573 domain-containing protein [Planctomycetota bacterium]